MPHKRCHPPFRSLLIGELAREPDVMVLELLRRARLAGYDGGKGALYALVEGAAP